MSMKLGNNDKRASDLGSNCIFYMPFRLSLFYGLVGVLIDADHPIAYYWFKIPDQRFLHPLVFGFSWVILGVGVALVGRLLCSVVLKKDDEL